MSDDRKKKYEDKRVIKRVSFNTTTESHLLEFADSIDFSTWVKQQILIDLELNSKVGKENKK
ncbi:hypothetical protein [Acinetobacter bereziniae]|uniref:Uncharacterized protein n=1 Tax=Acinetobacter bereziniae NIPH 3 TaxID=1217651 RepID=N8YM99_ACIBZ|nr:hypothetical protein [Acinetobacter bereziniae]ENV20380.1 hypothetical protein F963_03665 [Acinetobacter bereziniae NIPH 3]